MAKAKNTATANNALLNKLKQKQAEKNAEFRNPYIEDKEFVTFPDFREQLEERVELVTLTKLKKHAKDARGNYLEDENGEYIWEELYAFIDARYPENWSFGGSALREIYNCLIDDEDDEESINEELSNNPITFYLADLKLTNGRNKGKNMVQWLTEEPKRK